MVRITSFQKVFETKFRPVPYTYPDLSTKSSVTSPFTIVFKEVGSGESTRLENDFFNDIRPKLVLHHS